LETDGKVFLQILGLMNARLERSDLGSEGEATVFPSGLARPCFLFATDVRARSIDFIVPLRLEEIEVFGELIKLGYTRSAALIGAYSMLLGALELCNVDAYQRSSTRG
jgi:hypothetical protein